MNNGIIEQMQAEIAELKAKVGALESANILERHKIEGEYLPVSGASIDGAIKGARKYNAQADRDEIIEKAKRDIAIEVKRKWSVDNSLRYIYYKNPSDLCGYVCDVEFIVNREKRTVVALLCHSWNGIMSRGIAKCDPSDCFNVHIGKAIALRRALGLEVPAEYLNAPQPTEVRVGDVILRRGDYASSNGLRAVTAVEKSKYYDERFFYRTLEVDVGGTDEHNVAKIVDDSRN